MLEAAIFRLIKVHFKGLPYYVDLLELFQETTYQTEMGQLIDLITAPEDHVDLSRFSLEKFVTFSCLNHMRMLIVFNIDTGSSLPIKLRSTHFISLLRWP